MSAYPSWLAITVCPWRPGSWDTSTLPGTLDSSWSRYGIQGTGDARRETEFRRSRRCCVPRSSELQEPGQDPIPGRDRRSRQVDIHRTLPRTQACLRGHCAMQPDRRRSNINDAVVVPARRRVYPITVSSLASRPEPECAIAWSTRPTCRSPPPWNRGIAPLECRSDLRIPLEISSPTRWPSPGRHLAASSAAAAQVRF